MQSTKIIPIGILIVFQDLFEDTRVPLVAAPDNLPDPDVLAEEIAENLENALGSFQEIIAQLKTKQ